MTAMDFKKSDSFSTLHSISLSKRLGGDIYHNLCLAIRDWIFLLDKTRLRFHMFLAQLAFLNER